MSFGEQPATRSRRGRRSRQGREFGSREPLDDERGGACGEGSDLGDAEASTPGPQEDPYEVARTIALKLLDRRDYTRAELAQRLARRDVPAEVAEQVLDRFEDVRLIDDQRYAERYAVARQQSRSLARRAVQRELLTKGIDPELAEAAVAAIDDDSERQAALEFARRKARPLAGLPRDTQYRRLAGALARKGYGGGLAHATVATVLAELASDADADAKWPLDGQQDDIGV